MIYILYIIRLYLHQEGLLLDDLHHKLTAPNTVPYIVTSMTQKLDHWQRSIERDESFNNY